VLAAVKTKPCGRRKGAGLDRTARGSTGFVHSRGEGMITAEQWNGWGLRFIAGRA
jgi:hypothetical protein